KDVVHIIIRSADVLYGSVYFYDFKTNEYVVKYRNGVPKKEFLRHVKEKNSLIGLLKDREGPVLCRDLDRWALDSKSKTMKEASITARKLDGDLILPIIVDNLLGFIVLGEKCTGESYSIADWNTFELVTYSVSMAVHNIMLSEEAIIDSLTGLYNKKHFFEQLREEIPSAIRYNEQLSLIILDIDYFKKYNDKYGHQYGDEVLKQITNCITNEVRPDDLVCRYGGDEIILILPNTDQKGAKVLAERLRKAVKTKLGLKEPITISMGISALKSEGTLKEYNTEQIEKELIDKADKALYISKQHGRDKLSISDKLILK
ncbi:GGDEF domain-containing protein, partial [bacterium]